MARSPTSASTPLQLAESQQEARRLTVLITSLEAASAGDAAALLRAADKDDDGPAGVGWRSGAWPVGASPAGQLHDEHHWAAHW